MPGSSFSKGIVDAITVTVVDNFSLPNWRIAYVVMITLRLSLKGTPVCKAQDIYILERFPRDKLRKSLDNSRENSQRKG
jgi:hypothetical protein